MSFLKQLLWSFTTREGRDDLFGRSKTNTEFYNRRLQMFRNFEDRYPEIGIYGSCDNFIGVIQWSDEIEQNCYCIRESETIEEALTIVKKSARDNRVYVMTLHDYHSEIPLLLPNYRTYKDYQKQYDLGLNILLAESWLHQNIASLTCSKEATKKIPTYNEEWLKKQTFKYLQKNDWPVEDFKAFVSLNRLEMLLVLSQVLQDASIDSVTPELCFQKIDLIKLNDTAKLHYEEQVKFWKKIFLVRFGYDFNFHNDSPRLFSESMS